ncbi:MAG: PspC domain-containing protein [Patescibacteria group bacterium]
MKKLKRSNKNKVIAGIFGGLGEYMDVDPTLLRLIGLLLFLITGLFPFLIVYIVAVLIVPKSEEEIKKDAQKSVWRKWWFWIIILLIILILAPILALMVFRGFGPIANINISAPEEVVRDFEDEQQIVVEEKEPEKENIISYLEENFVEDNHGGEVFADYHRFGRGADELYIWAYISEYYLEDGDLKIGSAASLPLSLKFEDGEVVNHVQPRDGAAYDDDVRRIFPSHIMDKILNIQEEAILSSENEYQDLISYLEETVKERAEEDLNSSEE